MGLSDLIYITLFFVVATFSLITIEYVSTNMINSFTNTTTIDNQTNATMRSAGEAIPAVTDGIVYIIFGLGLSSIILASLIPVSPVFLPISVIGLTLYTFFAIINANVMYEYVTGAGLINVANTHPVLVALITQWPLFITALGFLIIIVMHGQTGGTENA